MIYSYALFLISTFSQLSFFCEHRIAIMEVFYKTKFYISRIFSYSSIIILLYKKIIFLYNLNNRVYIREQIQFIFRNYRVSSNLREAAKEEIVQTNIYKNPYVHDKDVYSVSLYSFCFFFSFIVKSYLNNVRTRRHNNDEPFKVTRESFRKVYYLAQNNITE